MIRRRRIRSLAAAVVALPLVALAVTGCGGGNGGSAATTTPTTANGRPATLGVANNGNLGKILIDSRARTLYLFQRDTGTKSACTGPCAAAWPPLRAVRTPAAGTGLTASRVGTAARSDGKPQVTYNGHPLYRYSGDQKPGDTNGQGLRAFGGGWFAVSSAGNMVSGTGSSSGGGGGY